MADVLIERLGPGDMEQAACLFPTIASVFETEVAPRSTPYLSQLPAREDLWAFSASSNSGIGGGLTAFTISLTSTEAREIFLNDIAVLPAFQRQGIGRRLVSSLRDHAAVGPLNPQHLSTPASGKTRIWTREITSRRSIPLKITLLLATFALSLAAQPAYVYAVHGIPGANGLPVDISVDGTCVVTGFTFGNVGGPLALPGGTYNVAIHLANSISPCGNAAVLTASPTLAAGNSYALVAHLTEAAGLKLSGFPLNLAKTAPGTGRFILHHTAAAPAVDVNVFRGDGNGRAPSVPVPGFKNGDQVPAEFRAGEWKATLSVGGQTVFGPTALVLNPKTAKLVFAVGVFPDSFTYIVKDIAIN